MVTIWMSRERFLCRLFEQTNFPFLPRSLWFSLERPWQVSPQSVTFAIRCGDGRRVFDDFYFTSYRRENT